MRPTPPNTRFALWSDGELDIERDGYMLCTLTAEEVRQLLRYLERMAEVSG